MLHALVDQSRQAEHPQIRTALVLLTATTELPLLGAIDAPDSELKVWGMTKVEAGAKTGSGKKGSKRRKKKAAVAVARKLAVLLHKLWVTGEVYDPQYNRKAVEAAQGKEKAAAA